MSKEEDYKPAAATEAVTWLSKDDAQLALFQAIQAIKLGNPTDDKMILANLREAGLWIGRYAAAPVVAAPAVTADEHEWLQYAIDHMRDDNEPEDATCANALEALLARIDSTPAAPGIDLATAIRNCCEAEKADPDHPDTISINVNDLTAIMQQCVIDASPKGDNDDARNAARYRHLRKVSPHKLRKFQDAAVTDAGDELYFHADRFDAALDSDMQATIAEAGK